MIGQSNNAQDVFKAFTDVQMEEGFNVENMSMEDNLNYSQLKVASLREIENNKLVQIEYQKELDTNQQAKETADSKTRTKFGV